MRLIRSLEFYIPRTNNGQWNHCKRSCWWVNTVQHHVYLWSATRKILGGWLNPSTFHFAFHYSIIWILLKVFALLNTANHQLQTPIKSRMKDWKVGRRFSNLVLWESNDWSSTLLKTFESLTAALCCNVTNNFCFFYSAIDSYVYYHFFITWVSRMKKSILTVWPLIFLWRKDFLWNLVLIRF
jgi:hypothetical protein